MKASPQTIYIPDTRGVTVSRYGNQNYKLGPKVSTYSRHALKTCPGASEWCSAACYAQRIHPPTTWVYDQNSGSDVPPIPAEAKILRIHVSGDFDSVEYIENWIARLEDRPDVRAWAYTRSWRVIELFPVLERLRRLPNIQLFASTDHTTGSAPDGWRVAAIQGDDRIHINALTCPEETGAVKDCSQCGYCWKPDKQMREDNDPYLGSNGDVTFLKH